MALPISPLPSGKALWRLLAAVLLVLPHSAVAQDIDLEPNFGSIELVSGFEPDPAEYILYAGGVIDLGEPADSNCVGFVSDSPDLRIAYSGAEFDYPLGFISEAEVDTVILVNAPDGSWYCNDDFSEELGFNAGIEFLAPQEGIYDVWVGVYEESAIYTPATLFITEIGMGSESSEQAGSNGPEDNLGNGTAFTIDDSGNLLTNYHVVEGCDNLTFRLPGQNPVAASVIATDVDADLALLSTNLLTVPATLKLQRPRLGDEIVVYGFPLLGDLSSQGNLTTGVVSGLTGLNDDTGTFQISAQIQPGNSGGPVIDRAGNVIGVVVSMANEQYFTRQSGATPQNVNFSITGNVILNFLGTNGFKPVQATDATRYLSVADIAEQAQRYTGALLCFQE